MILVLFGILVGVPITLIGQRLIESMLYGVRGELASLVLSIGLLFAVAMIAGFLPAHRASRFDPMVALRYE